MSEPYDLRSNIKGKPGSQGTLFQVKDKGLLNPAQRWPRGYTPERQEEVRGELFADHLGRNTRFFGAEGRHDNAVRARFVDTVARSTMPARHLNNLGEVTEYPAKDTRGTYWPGMNSRLAVNLHTENEGDRAGQTLLHELGHHHANQAFDLPEPKQETVHAAAELGMADWRRSRGPNASDLHMAEGRVRMGMHEGYADNYMTEHYRTRGRNPQPVTEGAYESNPNFAGGRLEREYPGYRDIRPRPQAHMGPQFRQGELF